MKVAFYSCTTALVMSLALGSTAAQAAKIPSYDSGQPSEHCKEQWTKRGVLDNRMYEYCMKKQFEGYANLKILISKYSQQKWLQAAVDHSVGKWTKRSVTQWNMVHYELNKITEAHEDIIYDMKQPGWNKSRFDACAQKWGIQLYMVTYCYKKK